MTSAYSFNQNDDAIAAISTPPGEGAISVVRISGKKALPVLDRVFSKKAFSMQSHKVYFGQILDESQKTIDTVLAFIMKAPKSYTGDDCVEISCHGGRLVTGKVLQRILEAGARPALPGEFTMRAFLNGKIDLAQAEAVQSLICAKNSLALKAAEEQLKGTLSQQIRHLQKELTEAAADLEAEADFPQEELELAPLENLRPKIENSCRTMQKLVSSFKKGRKLEEGIKLAIAGTPNVGKSSLMNALCQKEKAIVTEIPGTTRDLIEETVFLAGSFHFRITDTAGIRTAEEKIEEEGIRRSWQTLKNADLLLLVLDANRPLNSDDKKLIENAKAEKTVLIWNKTDLNPRPEKIGWDYEICICAKQQKGLDRLYQIIKRIMEKHDFASQEEIVLTRQRHKEALQEALESCQRALQGIKEKNSVEFIAADLRLALSALAKIIGHDLTEDILSRIFSKFCIGK